MEEKKQNGFGNGFFLGLIFGIIVTLLLTTKKGRKILRVITDEGMNRVARWEDLLQKPDVELEEETDYVKEDVSEVASELETMESEHEDHEEALKHHTNGHSKKPSGSRRFFRGVSKK